MPSCNDTDYMYMYIKKPSEKYFFCCIIQWNLFIMDKLVHEVLSVI